MLRRGRFVFAGVAVLCFMLCASLPARGQGRGGGPPGGGGMGGPPGGGMGGPPGGERGGMGRPQFPGDRGGMNVPDSGPRVSAPRGTSEMRPGLQLGPVDQRWWDERSYVKSLKLRPDQQEHMDAIFEQNRLALVSRFAAVQQAEAHLNDLAAISEPDEAALFAQIDRVAQARADLEKATTHLLLQLRRQMDADQIKKLESRR